MTVMSISTPDHIAGFFVLKRQYERFSFETSGQACDTDCRNREKGLTQIDNANWVMHRYGSLGVKNVRNA